jgi:hypothetical protein
MLRRVRFATEAGFTKAKNDCIKFFFTSRDVQAVSVWLQDLPHHDIRIGANENDIKLFVQSQVDQAISGHKLLLGTVTPELRALVIEKLTDGAQGMFKWADLQLQRIANDKIKSEADVLHKLDEPLKVLQQFMTKSMNRFWN